MDRAEILRLRQERKRERRTHRRRLGPGAIRSARECLFGEHPYCHWCGNRLGVDVSLEHIIPVSEGGDDRIENLALSCQRYNTERGWPGREMCERIADNKPPINTFRDELDLVRKLFGELL